MRDKSHEEQVILWAEHVRNSKPNQWKRELKPFLDSQIIIANRALKKLSKTEEGRKKLLKIRKSKVNNHWSQTSGMIVK